LIKRIVDISEASYIHLKDRQLIIDREKEFVGSIPIEDLGILILQHPAIVMTQALIIACQENNVAVVFCDERHLPYSCLLPLCEGHSLHSKILKVQTSITPPIKNRLWQQVVKFKIRNQIDTLELANKNTSALERLLTKVKSGDPENIEAQAARNYWRILFGEGFRRDIDAPGVNSLLNYGYAVMRAMIARSIVSSGLHPAFGLHHSNQYNGLCLADDLMEPFRPWVDWLVYSFAQQNNNVVVNHSTKQILLGLLVEKVLWEKQSMPLMVACHYFMANLKVTFEARSSKLVYPKRQ